MLVESIQEAAEEVENGRVYYDPSAQDRMSARNHGYGNFFDKGPGAQRLFETPKGEIKVRFGAARDIDFGQIYMNTEEHHLESESVQSSVIKVDDIETDNNFTEELAGKIMNK